MGADLGVRERVQRAKRDVPVPSGSGAMSEEPSLWQLAFARKASRALRCCSISDSELTKLLSSLLASGSGGMMIPAWGGIPLLLAPKSSGQQISSIYNSVLLLGAPGQKCLRRSRSHTKSLNLLSTENRGFLNLPRRVTHVRGESAHPQRPRMLRSARAAPWWAAEHLFSADTVVTLYETNPVVRPPSFLSMSTITTRSSSQHSSSGNNDNVLSPSDS